MIVFKRISDFKGTSDKREFQPYGMLLIIALWIVSSVSSGLAGPIELSLKCAGLVLVLLPLPALITRRLRGLGYLTMGKVLLGLLSVCFSLGSIYMCIPSMRIGWISAIIALSFFLVKGLWLVIFLLCFFKSSKVKDTK